MSGQFYTTKAWAKASPTAKFEQVNIKRGETGPDDVEFDIKFCGICHSDVHLAQDEFGVVNSLYPMVPGHELAGIVSKVGANVKSFKVGDKVGVGCIVEACLKCKQCKGDDEPYCVEGFTHTYTAEHKHGQIKTEFGFTQGGYSGRISVHEHFAIRIPESYPLEMAGPIFCAGITMYSPLKHWRAIQGGLRVGIIGIGGLGQMGVRLAKAMGNEVTAISTSPSKEGKAKQIGADHFVVSTNPNSMAKAAGSLDLILDTVSADHQAGPYMSLLDKNGTLVLLGLTNEVHQVPGAMLLFERKSLTGSSIGGIKDTQEVIDFCAAKNIKPAIQIVTGKDLDQVYSNLSAKNDSAHSKDDASVSVVVNNDVITPAPEIELLGVPFDRNFSTLPQEAILARDTKQRAGLVARLAHHLPRGEYLRHLAKGLVVGKVGYAAAVVVPPRLISVNEPTSNSLKATQVAINDVARTVIGQSRGDRYIGSLEQGLELALLDGHLAIVHEVHQGQKFGVIDLRQDNGGML
eukprot:maker-scaffold534_size144770-snap-gene-0.36 protein:Tk11147 transcript:maker-scaffold534_size144770-snap-gene-0.36-mRNA-1 annotation:"zinc-binding dehydrogenase"